MTRAARSGADIALTVQAIAPLDLAGFSYVEHAENVALALKVCAGVGVDRATALQALACNPITADLDKAAPCLTEMLEQNRSLLPRFFE